MLTIEQFGTSLLKSGDLDPVYLAVNGAIKDAATKRRLCLAYWCFYHLGFASWVAEKKGKAYWEAMNVAAANEEKCKFHPSGRWPRGAERRHFRGAQATSAMSELSFTYGLRGADGFCINAFVPEDGAQPTFGGVSARVREHRGFGDWIAFKIADMGERVLGYNVDFSNCELGIYKDPRQGAALAFYEGAYERGDPQDNTWQQKPWEFPVTDEQLRQTVAYYTKVFRKVRKVPGLARPVNVQEVETIFCKYKSHRKGHYPLGKDTVEIREGLHGWGDLATELAKHLPKIDAQKELAL